jgi:hypothetical protein
MTSTENGDNGKGIEAQRAKAMLIYRENIAPGLSVEMDLHRVLVSTTSDFQKIDVLDTYFGKVRTCAPTVLLQSTKTTSPGVVKAMRSFFIINALPNRCS